MVDRVVIQEAPKVDDPTHTQAMIDLADGKGKPAEGAPVVPAEGAKAERPADVPEKFWDAEKGTVNTDALLKSYSELEAAKSGKKTEPEASQTAPEAVPSDDAAKNALATQGLDLNAFSKEFDEKGALSNESYEALKARGFDKDTVDDFIAGRLARRTAYENDVKSAAGGEDGFSKMTEWAKVNLTDEEKTAFNNGVNSGNAAQAKLTVAGLYAKFSEANPTEPSLIQGRSSASLSGDSYQSLEQMKEDMRNPKYKADPAFREMVKNKLGRSNIM